MNNFFEDEEISLGEYHRRLVNFISDLSEWTEEMDQGSDVVVVPYSEYRKIVEANLELAGELLAMTKLLISERGEWDE